MNIQAIQIFQIDLNSESVLTVDKSKYGPAFDDYLEGLIEIILKGGSGRSFEFDRETTEVRNVISKIISGEDFSTNSKTIADRLFQSEKDAQKNIDKLGKEIRKGILVQALIEDNNLFQFIVCKADESEFLKDDDYTLTKGLPLKKKVFKAFVANCSLPNLVNSILVFDTNQTIAKYWWKGFLELVEIYTDEHNTITAFEAIDKIVFDKMRREFPKDYVYLRNSTVRYFRAT